MKLKKTTLSRSIPMKLNQIKGIKLDILLAESIMKLNLQDLTTRIRKIDGYDIVNGKCIVKTGFFTEAFSYKNESVYAALIRKLYTNLNYVEKNNNKLWHSKLDEFECYGRTPEEAVSRVICCKAFGKTEITKQDMDLSIFKVTALIDEDDE